MPLDNIPLDATRWCVRSITQAKALICTAEDSTTEQRWQNETPYLADLIVKSLDIQARHKVLDFGCGVGRISKELIKRSGCSVFGVDTSVSMRSLAPSYVLDRKFLACAPEMLPLLARANFAVSVWTLQHIPELRDAIETIHHNLVSFGQFFVVNLNGRSLPVDNGKWYDDKQDTRELLCARFHELAFGRLDSEKTTPRTASRAFWGIYERGA
jgi:SAM-dependent methyltransferase